MSVTRAGSASAAAGPHVPATLGRAALAATAVTLLLAWALAFSPQLVAGRVFVLGDAAAYRPFAAFSRDEWLVHHRRAFWNPYVFTGLPAAASLADPTPQFLPDPLLTLWHRAAGGTPAPLAAPLAAHLLGMLAAAALARALWGAGVAAMACAGIVWGWTPLLLVPLGFGHDAQFVSSALMPVVLLAVHAVFATRGWGATLAALGLALALGLSALAGHPQIVAYSAVLAVAFALERARRFGRAAPLALAAGAAVLGAALSAASWWPAWLYSAHSTRGGAAGLPVEAATDWSLAPRDLLALVWPRAVGFGGATYWGGMRATDFPPTLGASALALALAAWPRRREGARATVLLFAAVLAIAALLSLGVHLGAVYGAIHAVVPFFNRFRTPVLMLIVGALATALLAARGVEALSRDAAARRMAGRAALGVGALAAGAGLALAAGAFAPLYAAAVEASGRVLDAPTVGAAARAAGLDLALRGALVLVLGAGWLAGARAGAAVAAVVLAADLGTVALPILRHASGPPSALASPIAPSLARVTAREPRSRCMPLWGAALFSNDWVSWRARALGGNHGAFPARWGDLARHGLPRRYRVLCALAVRYIDADTGGHPDPALFEPLRDADGVSRVWRLIRARPRAYAVPLVIALPDDDAVLRGMASPRFDPAILALTAEPGIAGEYRGAADCEIGWAEDAPDRVVLDVRARSRAFVVLADLHFPGWRATLDGAPLAIHRVDHLVRGLVVGPGEHRAVLDYQPEGWAVARPIALAGWTSWIALAAAAALARRRATGATRSLDHPGARS